ncbi:MAG TPA: carboxypeptidase-like regulatory domain-containing protein [Polyangia bacterium]|jgi:hypothetical protein|nr:carboxypeptidase-like regulatory domain-containing protein [Polyangia bacterium]
MKQTFVCFLGARGVALVAVLAPTSYSYADAGSLAEPRSGTAPPSDGGNSPHDAGITLASSESRANISGTVVAFDGRTLPADASVKLVASESGEQRVCALNAGRYSCPVVHAGTYDLQARAAGLATEIQEAIHLKDGDTIQRNIVLGEREWSARAKRWIPLLFLALYLIGMLITRWFKIVRPNLNRLRQYIDHLKVQVAIYPGPNDPTTTLNGCDQAAKATFKDWRWWFRMFFWSQGEENATWCRLHEIEGQLALGLPAQPIRTHLIVVEPKLRELNTPSANALADAIHDELKASGSADLPLRQQLLSQAWSIVFDVRDERFIALSDWQNKATWLALVASMLIVVVGAVQGQIMLFVAGAAGGLLSRMMRAIRQPEFSTDYGASWNTLFLSPLFGALFAWFGVLLLVVLRVTKGEDVGPLLALVQWDHSLSTLAVAFLLGFSERFGDSIIEAAHSGGTKAGSGPPSKPAAT